MDTSFTVAGLPIDAQALGGGWTVNQATIDFAETADGAVAAWIAYMAAHQDAPALAVTITAGSLQPERLVLAYASASVVDPAASPQVQRVLFNRLGR
jgi:hypothetical protein